MDNGHIENRLKFMISDSPGPCQIEIWDQGGRSQVKRGKETEKEINKKKKKLFEF